MSEKKDFNAKSFAILLIIILVIIIIATYVLLILNFNNKNAKNVSDNNNDLAENNSMVEVDKEVVQAEVPPVAAKNEYALTDNNLSKFDLSFLKFENEKVNKIYSPLSIKYAFKMLNEGANGETKRQLDEIIGEYNFKNYIVSKNLSFANSLFIRDSFKDNIKDSYINILKQKYNAEVNYDSFENANTINNWIKDKTFNIIPQIVNDSDLSSLDFALINALAIDMDWEDKFIHRNEDGWVIFNSTNYQHEQGPIVSNDEYDKNWLDVYDIEKVENKDFHGEDKDYNVAGMYIKATINNYDIINELGEENIRNIVSNEYRKFVKGEEYDKGHVWADSPFSNDNSDDGIQKDLDGFLSGYIPELNENYHKIGKTTDFSIYTDDDVKVFAKDLKEYDGTNLQYIGIMPINEKLDSFVENLDVKTISNYTNNLKSLKTSDFKEGVVTCINGFIPKFNFEYSLDLMNDLNKLGVTDVFDSEKADLTNLTDTKGAYISSALHKANIEFTEDGIKAAAATFVGGSGAGSPFDYIFDVPTEYIDMTFDKPYMFLIRDKESGETWFAGTVYEPLLWENEPSNNGNNY